MGAHQFKSRFVVIEPRWLPIIKCVALFAGGLSVVFELPVMLVGMTICAAFCQAFELLMDFSLIIFPEMAIATA